MLGLRPKDGPQRTEEICSNTTCEYVQRRRWQRTASELGTLKRPRTCSANVKTEDLWAGGAYLPMGLGELGAALGWPGDAAPADSTLLVLDATTDASFLLPLMLVPALNGIRSCRRLSCDS